MRKLRQIANGVVRGGLAHLDDAPPEALRRAFRVLRWLAARFGATLPMELDDRLVRSAVGVVARAITETPYGQPLRFECPLFVTIAVSDYCPFACSNCYSNSGGTGSGSRAIEQDPASFERLADSRTPIVLVTGGEPMVSKTTLPGVLRLLDAAKTVLISTNASIEAYLNLAVRYPLLIFILPVWGNRAQHDALRGHRSFERVEQNLESLNRVGRAGWLLLVLTGSDWSLFDDVVELVRTHRVSLVRITRKVRIGRSDDLGPQVTPQFVRAVQEGAKRLRRFVPNVVIDLPEMRSSRGASVLASTLGIPHYPSCAAGNWMMHIDSRGDAYPCYTFEGGTTARVAPMPSVTDQWRLIQERRAALGDGDICIGETLATREETVPAEKGAEDGSDSVSPLRFVQPPGRATMRLRI